jgi:hypothetical protein
MTVGRNESEFITNGAVEDKVCILLCVFTKNCQTLLLASKCLSARLSVDMEQLGPHWTDLLKFYTVSF